MPKTLEQLAVCRLRKSMHCSLPGLAVTLVLMIHYDSHDEGTLVEEYSVAAQVLEIERGRPCEIAKALF